MISAEVRKKIREIEIRVKRLLNSSLVGDSRTAQKGMGMEFDQLRQYQIGDDIRFIDWKATARTQKFLVRQYFQERNRKIMLMVDVSASTAFGSGNQRVYDRIAEVATVLSLVAQYGNDQIGLVLFSDEIKKVIPMAKGSKQIHAIMEALFSFEPDDKTVSYKVAFDWLARFRSGGMLTFLISDFIGDDLQSSMKTIGRKHEMVAIRCLDPLEYEMPPVGLLFTKAQQEKSTLFFDVSSRSGSINKLLAQRIEEQTLLIKKRGIDIIDIVCGKPYMLDIINFFRRRMMY